MSIPLTFRKLFMFGGLTSLLLLGSAYFLEYYFVLDPCPLCLLQRYILWGMVVIFLLGALQNCRSFGRLLYCIAIETLCILGIILAGRHVWLQHLPPTSSIPTCTAGFEKMLTFKPLHEILKTMLTESHACAQIDFTLLGFSLSAWSLLFFMGLALFILIIFTLQIKRRI